MDNNVIYIVNSNFNINDVISTLSLVVSIIALIPALYGAILSTYVAITEAFKLKLEVFNLNETYITLTESGDIINNHGEYTRTYYEDFYTVAILVRITNKSKSPITINEIVLNDEYRLTSFHYVECVMPSQFKYQKDKLVAKSFKRLLTGNAVKPLLKINGLDSYEGYLIFNKIKSIPTHFDIKVHTSRKSKKFNPNITITNNYIHSIVKE